MSIIRRVGGKLMVELPEELVERLNLVGGMPVEVSGDTGKIHVRRPRYTLDELLQGHDGTRDFTAEERAWIDAPPVGREVF